MGRGTIRTGTGRVQHGPVEAADEPGTGDDIKQLAVWPDGKHRSIHSRTKLIGSEMSGIQGYKDARLEP